MAEEKKAEGEGEAKAEGEAKPKSKKKLIIILAAVLLLGGGGAAFMLMGSKPAGEHAEQEQEKEKHYELAQLEPIIVNLGESTSFLKVTMLIQYDPEVVEKAEAKHKAGGGGGGKGGGHGGGGAGGEGGEKAGGLPGPMAEKLPIIKDSIIRVLSSKRAEEVLTTDGKEKLKEELVEAINEVVAFDEPPVVGVFFTEFLIQ